ncbi:MAG: hypothetical protein Q8O29_00900 [Polaromonas sp.]|uniref:hypothetical protein n=1 Tax=Polaromonas sp. TaxID=1869339 RepID=UPI002732706B|nr:hypothetical protein [Polaromonas sp.]MDP2816837.1 hypothetical protein [Polaromonas sp.]
MDIIYSPFGELPDDEWKSAVAGKIAEYKSRLATYSGPAVEHRVRETNHGRGADLVTITVSLISLGGVVFFGIPAAHKKVREAIEEWGKIKDEIGALANWITRDKPSLPIEILFLEAITDLAKSENVEEMEFLSACEIPTQNIYGFDDIKTYLFILKNRSALIMTAWDSHKNKLWLRQIELLK